VAGTTFYVERVAWSTPPPHGGRGGRWL
jgi:hypothetical protein